ncbi:MAG: hypothetical protein D8M58_20100 [Calditrichaeota bacterium]|nr:MAG: hypothetical protein DWQ03_14085 [Calditrichota bacterium]MBL1207713.1 hypothetical protein [Calditrichota bacterium]NOG47548.1 hypothetical protein [Calditrichota bacterium]
MRLISFVLLILFSISLYAGETKTPMPQPEEQSGGFDITMGLSAGAAVLDGEVYNQIGIRPLITMGKLGIALDLSLYLDADGNIRKENWDEASDFFEKLYFVRWARPGDPFYVKAGAIDNYTLGYGLLMNHYSNAIEYPSVIRTGMEIGLQGDRLGFQGMVNNFSETFDGGGVVAGRLSFKVIGDLELGVSAVADINQFKGLKDRDGDGVPDFVDDFPNKKKYSIDTDGDGVPDGIDPDQDGDGYTDNSQDPLIANNDPDGVELKGDPLNIKNAKDKDQLAFAADIAYPVVKQKYLNLTVYSQFAQFMNDGGWGASAPGVRAKFAFINAFAEYRIFDEKFLPEYFNTTYELERVTQFGDSVLTKRQKLQLINEKLQGYVIGADFNIADFIVFGAEYQNMSKNKVELKTFRANLDLNSDLIPKIKTAGAYFYQNNTGLKKLFDKTEGTIIGYKFGYDIGGGAALVFDFRQTFRDKDGNGIIKGSDETIKSTLIQTVFTF